MGLFAKMPPAWDEIAKTQDFQNLTPNEKANVQRRWVFDRMNYDYDHGRKIDQAAMVKEFKGYGFEPTVINTGFKDFTDYRSYKEGQPAQGLEGDALQEALQPQHSASENFLIDMQQAAGALGSGLVRPFEGMAGFADMTVGNVVEAVADTRLGLDKLSDNLHQQIEYFGRGVEADVVGGFREGGIKGGANALVNMVLNELPNQVVQMGAGALPRAYALAILGAGAMGSKYNEIKNDKSLNEFQKYAIATTSGTIEALTELIDTIPFMQGVSEPVKAQVLRDALRSKPIKTLLKKGWETATGEAFEEAVGELAQNVSEAIIRGEKIDPSDLKNQIVNAAIGGGVMGGGMAVFGHMANRHYDSQRTSRKAFQEMVVESAGINRKAIGDKAYNDLVNQVKLDEFGLGSVDARRRAVDNYDFHGEPITFGEATKEDRINALKERIAWYDNIKDRLEDGEEKAEWEEHYNEWQEKLAALEANSSPRPRTRMPLMKPPVTEEGKPVEVVEVKEEEETPPVTEPVTKPVTKPVTPEPVTAPPVEEQKPVEQPKGNFKAQGETTEERIASLVEHVHSPKAAQHADGSAGGSFVHIVVDIAPGGDVKTSSDKNYGKNGVILQNKENGAQRDAQIKQMKDHIVWKEFFGDDWTHKGTPIIGMDGNTESGNTRLDVLRQLYREGKAEEYRKMAEEVAKKLGISTEGMEMPADIRVNVTEMTDAEREDFVRRANKNMEMRQLSEANQAQDDARAFADHQDELLSLYHAPDDLTKIIGSGKDDMAFLNRFRELVGANPGDVDENANYTESFFKRIRNTFLGALFNKLPNGRGLIKDFTNTDEMKTVLNGLVPCVPRLLKQAAANPDYDITSILGNSLRQLKRYKEEREQGLWKSPEDFARQGDLWDSEKYMSPVETEMFLNLAHISSMKEMRQLMKQYMDAVSQNTGTSDLDNGLKQQNLFAIPTQSRDEIIMGMKDFVKKRKEAEGRRLRGRNGKRDAYAVAYDKEAADAPPLVEGARVATKKELKQAGMEGTAKQTPTESDVEKVNKLVNRAKTLFPAFKFVVHATQEEAAQFVSIPAGKAVNAWNDNGTIHVVAENIMKTNDPYQILTGHEIVGHSGLKMVIGKTRWNAVMEQIFRDHDAEIKQSVDDYGFDYDTAEGRVEAAEEWLATIARMETRPSWWRALISKIRNILRMVSMGRLKWTDADIENLIAEGTQAARNSQAQELADSNVRFSIRKDDPPKKTGIGYKVFFMKDGKLYPPKIANPGGEDTPTGVWLDADAAPIVGQSKTGRAKVKQGGKGTEGGSGTLAYRPGWHLGEIPYALQFNRGEKVDNPVGMTNEKGEVIKVGRYFPKDFVWAEVEYAADEDYQKEAESYGYDEKGKFRHSFAGLPKIPKDGYYRYRTNPNPATDPWIITGAMKVNRILTKEEVDEIVKKAGRTPQEVEPDGKANNSVKFSMENDLSAVNEKFNKELQQQINGTIDREHIYQLGMPNAILQGTGIPNLPIELTASRLKEKATNESHPFDLSDIANLPEALDRPLAVFAYGDPKKAQNVIVELSKDGKNFVVGLTLHSAYRGVEVNDIRGLFPKDTEKWLNWIKENKSLYLNKQKIQGIIAQQRTNFAEVSYLHLDDVLKIVADFKNANDSDKKFSLEQTNPLPAKPEDLGEKILNDATKDPNNAVRRLKKVLDTVSTHPVEDLKSIRLPLMIELANRLGATVKSTDRLPAGVLGMFRHDGPEIQLLRKLAASKDLGDPIVTSNPEEQIEKLLSYWEQLGIPRNEIEVINKPITGSDESIVKLVWRDKSLSLLRKVAAHEVGHLIDFTSGSTTHHGNVLGTVAGTLYRYLKHVIGEDTDSPIDWDAWESRKKQLHKTAEKMAGKKPTDETQLKAWRQKVKDNYRDLYNMECDQNGWFQKAVVRNELKELTEWWSGDIEDPDYRLKPTELYAEAMSVLFNTPEQLTKRAPETWRMIQNYLAEKPGFKMEWLRLMNVMKSEEAYGEELLKMQERGFDMGEAQKGTTAAEPTWKDRIRNMGRETMRNVQDVFYEINAASANLRQMGVIGWNESPDEAISTARHSSVRDNYMKAASDLEKPLVDMGITQKDIGLYLLNMRLQNDLTLKDNEAIINSYGMNSTDDPVFALDALKKHLGEEKWQALEDWHAKFWQLRKDTILQLAADSGAYSKELVEHMLNNEWYSYRMVTTQLLDDDGRARAHGSGARIYGLKGTLSPQANPLGWTYENDLRLMQGILWNDARMKTGEMMKSYFPNLVQSAKVKGRDMNRNLIYADPEKGMARIVYLLKGDLVHIDIPETWAAGFMMGGASETVKTLSALTNIWRLAYTTYSRTFGAQNPIRDFESSFQNMTYMGGKPSWIEWSRYWWKGMKEAFGEEFGNDPWFRRIFGDSYVNGSAISQEMERLNMFQSEAHGYGDAQTQHDRLMQRYGIIKMDPRGWEKYVPSKVRKVQQFVSAIVNAEEHGTKIGGYLMMNDKMPNMSIEEKRWHVHRHIGSPDFTVKGKFTPLTNTILIFSNASIQGWKATAESYKANPKVYAANWMYSVALPKFIQWSLASGALLAAAKMAGMDDDNPVTKMLEWFKRMYGKISQYNRSNYMCLPVAETDSGKCVFLRIPMAENSKPGAMIFQALLESRYNKIPNSKSAAEKTGDAVVGALPNMNPMLMFLWDLGWLSSGKNVRDFHTGRFAVDQDLWAAGGSYRAWGSAKYLWHEYVPETGLRFDTRNNTWLYDLIANNLGFGALVKLSDYGEKEQERAVKEIDRKKRARTKMQMPGAGLR